MWLPLFAGVNKKNTLLRCVFLFLCHSLRSFGIEVLWDIVFHIIIMLYTTYIVTTFIFLLFFRYYITVRPPVYIGTLEYSDNPKEIFGIVTATTTSVNNAADSIRNEIAKQTMNSALSSYGNCMFGPMKPSKVWNQFETTRNSIFRLCVRVFFFVLSFRFSFVENLKKKCDKSNLVNAESVYKFQKLK